MSLLQQKKILLGVTGGIAAYKSADLCRQLVKLGAEVRVVMTHGAREFVQPLSFQALSGNPVHTELLDPAAEAGMGHIELAKWPDLILVAPATANFIAQYANGFANDLLTTIMLATESPVCLAPAMNQAMWRHPTTQANVTRLKELLADGLTILGPADGEQACGDIGPGRMLEPLEIADRVRVFFESDVREGLFAGKRVVLTAGPTREAIDPVRYISNHSSGKMGYALAQAFAQQGAEVVIVSGPVTIPPPKGVERRLVESAVQMHDAVHHALAEGCDIFVAAAAVADYRPHVVSDKKMKKQGAEGLSIELQQNPDIVASVAALEEKPFVVGFAAETNDVIEYATKKLNSKKLNMIIANDVSKPGIGFNSDQNAVHVVTQHGVQELPEQSKTSLANALVRVMAEQVNK